MTLPFWYLFQEALWSTDTDSDSGFYVRWDEGGGEVDASVAGEGAYKEGHARVHTAQVAMEKAVYSELVRVLRRKVVFPPPGSASGNGWSKGLLVASLVCLLLIADSLVSDQVDKFQV